LLVGEAHGAELRAARLRCQPGNIVRMRLHRITSLFLSCGAIAAPLTVERIASASSIAGTPPSSPTWSPDSRRLAFLWSSEGQPGRGERKFV